MMIYRHYDLSLRDLPLNNRWLLEAKKVGSRPFYGFINKNIESVMGGYSLILSLILSKLKLQNIKAGTIIQEVKACRYFPPLCPCPSLSQPSLNAKFRLIPPALPLFSKVVVCVTGRVMSCRSE